MEQFAQIAEWLGAIPVATSDYLLRGKFQWWDNFNDWLDQSWLGQPLPTGIAILMFIVLLARR